jgi:uncharacterized membrane protein YfcA
MAARNRVFGHVLSFNMLTVSTFIILAGALAGGFVSGLAGFGTGLTALGIWLHVIAPDRAATLVIVCSIVAQVQTLPTIWHAIDRRRLLPFILPGVIGVPIGAKLLTMVNPDVFRIAAGISLLGFASFMLFGRPTAKIAWGGRIADGAIGFAGGVLGGLAGLSGPLPTLWASLRRWSKDERRAVFQAFNFSILATALFAHAVAGLIDRELLHLMVFALPGTISGAWLGAWVYRRLSDRHFDRVVLYLLAMSGMTLIWTALWR